MLPGREGCASLVSSLIHTSDAHEGWSPSWWPLFSKHLYQRAVPVCSPARSTRSCWGLRQDQEALLVRGPWGWVMQIYDPDKARCPVSFHHGAWHLARFAGTRFQMEPYLFPTNNLKITMSTNLKSFSLLLLLWLRGLQSHLNNNNKKMNAQTDVRMCKKRTHGENTPS